MATKKRAALVESDDEVVVAEIELAVGGKAVPKFDVNAWLQATVDDISRKQGVDADPMEDFAPMSTGLLMLDILYGGGIRPAMYTHAGWEQTAKTTLALSIMVSAINAKVPLIAFWDYEGCVTADTYISYGRGKQARLKDLFDLSKVSSWKSGTYPGQTRTDIDTVEPGHRYGGTGVRTGSLFYKGKRATTKVTFNTGHSLVGHGHKMYVLRDGRAEVTKLEDLQVGEQVLVSRKFFEGVPEEWRSVRGFGKIVAQRYEVSNMGRVRSVDFDHVVTRTLKNGNTFNSNRTVTGRILVQNQIKDGHCWVALCDGQTQRKRLVHRIVARTFLGKAPLGQPHVLHWNDDPTDNRLTNLRYGSDADNSRDRVVRGRSAKAEQIHTTKLSIAEVAEIRNLIQENFDDVSIAEIYGVHAGTIYAIRTNVSWAHALRPEEFVKFETDAEVLKDYELSAVTSVELTGKKEHVFDVSLLGVAQDALPHSIVTNGIVTHNSTKNSKPYIANILRTMGAKVSIKDVFGKKDRETGKWLTKPIIQYYNEAIGEKFFDWLHEIERKYPDKKFIGGEWWLIYEDTKINRAAIGDSHNQKMAKKYGKGLWVPAPDGNLQAVIVVDSWPAMNPETNDSDTTDNSLGVHARFFAKQLPRIKGRMGKKMIALLGMNQLADIPMAMYGPKEQETCGKRLRFYSDVRVRNTARASGMPFFFEGMFDKEEGTEKERSITGEGHDRYRYIQTKTVKNKLSTPGRRGWARLWVEDASGGGCGFDPFYDTMVYLESTGQLTGSRKKLVLNIEGHEAKKPATWMQMKHWVLGTKEQKIQICKELGYPKAFDLRPLLFKQVASGRGEDLFMKTRGEAKAAAA